VSLEEADTGGEMIQNVAEQLQPRIKHRLYLPSLESRLTSGGQWTCSRSSSQQTRGNKPALSSVFQLTGPPCLEGGTLCWTRQSCPHPIQSLTPLAPSTTSRGQIVAFSPSSGPEVTRHRLSKAPRPGYDQTGAPSRRFFELRCWELPRFRP
jgi:hypothetical protein